MTASNLTEAEKGCIIYWLYLCAGMVAVMVMLGGAVRLTGSGLSMVEWKPLMGILPPMSQTAWEEVFARYREYPEYLLVNRGMTLNSFQFIYYMEYFHRILGRLIGVVFFLPFVYWLLKGRLPFWIRSRLWIALGLGALQGLLGWYMVQSGLVGNPHVSQYRLTAHLMLAIFIFAWLLMAVFRLQADGIKSSRPSGRSRLILGAGITTVLVFIMISTGGFMAGTKAGFILNTWPMMGDSWMPDQVWAMEPWWRNLFDNPMGVQFVHRWLAIAVLVAVSCYGLLVVRHSSDRVAVRLGMLMVVMVWVQVILGITTLIKHVPLTLGVIHQGGALILLTFLLALWSRLSRTDSSA